MSHSMDHAYERMTAEMSDKMSQYYVSLQARYGDPRVYAMQREQMDRETARLLHERATTNASALRSAYEQERAKVTEEHARKFGS